MEWNSGVSQALEILYRVLLVSVLWATAMALGMSLETQSFVSLWRNKLRLLGIVGLNVLVFPALALFVVYTLPVSPNEAIGLLLLAAAAGGPYALKVAEIGGGIRCCHCFWSFCLKF